VKQLRILIATHAPLSPEFGAAQMAINLGDALRGLGHDVTVWSPLPLPAGIKWWRSIYEMNKRFENLVESHNSWDVIDCPAIMLTARISSSAKQVIARTVQPDILYLLHSLRLPSKKSTRDYLRFIAGIAFSFYQVMLVIGGWSRASKILCLGILDYHWMKKWFPFWSNKVFTYGNALSSDERSLLAQVRNRRKPPHEAGLRFLWIGRWTPHKGISELVAFILRRVESYRQDTFTIAGCGMAAYKEFSDELLSSGRVKIIPTFERAELFSLLENHDVGLFTSRVEGWGLVLNEMLESGLMVYATEAGGVPELRVFFPDSLMSFPPTEEIPINFKEFIVDDEYFEHFSWAAIALGYLKLIG